MNSKLIGNIAAVVGIVSAVGICFSAYFEIDYKTRDLDRRLSELQALEQRLEKVEAISPTLSAAVLEDVADLAERVDRLQQKHTSLSEEVQSAVGTLHELSGVIDTVSETEGTGTAAMALAQRVQTQLNEDVRPLLAHTARGLEEAEALLTQLDMVVQARTNN